MKKTEEKVKEFICQHHLLTVGARVVVGVSGGADSVCLAYMLGKLGYEVVAVHCNFHLRGEESMRDERFVEGLCERLGLVYRKVDFDTERHAEQQKVSIEMAARELRYRAFRNIKDEHCAEAVAVGHHQDDNAETMMLNLVRGSGIKGLCGMQPRNGDIVRPLLCLTRQEVTAYLQEAGLDYVTDGTNAKDIYARNKVRLNVMPMLESINKGAMQNIVSTMDNLNEVQKVYRRAMDDAIRDCCRYKENGEIHIIIYMLRQLPSPISLLHEVLSPIGFNKKQLKDILASLDNTGCMYLSNGQNRRRLLIDREAIIVEGINYTPTIYQEVVPIEKVIINKRANYAYLDADKLCGNGKGEPYKALYLRTPEMGDTFAPFGMEGRRKLLSDFLTDLKLNRFEKEWQQLLMDGDEIAWVVNRRSSERYRISETTKNVVVVWSEISTEK
ncbi:MAG: tRNA lysidine(34) synthetase TilS [Prevotellaceae bacterium]|nr:tRNA lysidine(34) synthetase TilS [Prevotellaceae bacterium]